MPTGDACHRRAQRRTIALEFRRHWLELDEQVAKLNAASANPLPHPYWHQRGFASGNPPPVSGGNSKLEIRIKLEIRSSNSEVANFGIRICFSPVAFGAGGKYRCVSLTDRSSNFRPSARRSPNKYWKAVDRVRRTIGESPNGRRRGEHTDRNEWSSRRGRQATLSNECGHCRQKLLIPPPRPQPTLFPNIKPRAVPGAANRRNE